METEQIILIVAVVLLLVSLILNIVILVKTKKTEGYAIAPQTLSQNPITFNIATSASGIRFKLLSSNPNVNGLQVITSGTTTKCYLVKDDFLVGSQSTTYNLLLFPNNQPRSLTLTYINNILSLKIGATLLYSGKFSIIPVSNVNVDSIITTDERGNVKYPGQTGYVNYGLTFY
jgi:hypothetical protein